MFLESIPPVAAHVRLQDTLPAATSMDEKQKPNTWICLFFFFFVVVVHKENKKRPRQLQ